MCPGGVRFIKPAEHLLNINLLRVFHVIGAPEDRFPVLPRQFQHNFGMSMHKSIPDQILYCPVHRLHISPDKETFTAEIHFRFDPPALKFIIKGEHRITDAFPEINALRLQLIVCVLKPCISKQFLQHLFQAGDPRLDDLCIFSLFFLRITLLEKLEIPVQRRERRADVMRQVGDRLFKLRLILLRALPDLP